MANRNEEIFNNFALMFSPLKNKYANPLRQLCRATAASSRTKKPYLLPGDGVNIGACCHAIIWIESQASKMVTVNIQGNEVVITFPQTDEAEFTDFCGRAGEAGLEPVWHGTSLWAAYHIWHHGFKIGEYGHKKNNRHVNGIWGMLSDFKHCLGRAATSKKSQELCSQCPNGEFDAWSTPVGIEFYAHRDEVTTCGGTEVGVCCIENMDHVSLNLAGYRARVQHRIHSIKFDARTYILYRDVLGDPAVRDQINTGELIMCSGRWCHRGMTQEELGFALVCPNRNPCGNVIHASHYNDWHKTNSKRFLCPECWRSA
jgi:hypothetical protein